MSERKFAVIGHPIGHTMSPFIHKRLFELAGLEGTYTTMDIPSERLPEMIPQLNMLSGYNITIPNKQNIIPFIDELDKKAQLYGSVNTVSNKEKRKGYTTDPDGFLKALSSADIALEGNVVIAGSGGAARTFVYEAALAGCSVTIVVRPQSISKGQALALEAAGKIPGAKISSCTVPEIESKKESIDLLVNATPVGMYPYTDAMPVSESVIERSSSVFDAIYNPLETKLIQAAKAMGIKAAGGMAMLVWQAAVSHEIWDGTVYSVKDMEKLIFDSAEEMQKIFHTKTEN